MNRLFNIDSLKGFSTLLVVVLFLSGCVRDPRSPGRVFVPDMQYSNAYETFATTNPLSPELGDTMTARLPVEGTIPRGFIKTDQEDLMLSYSLAKHFKDPNYYPELNTEQYELAGSSLKNPVPHSKETLAEGKKMYNIYCAVCHGEKGAGNGQIIEPADGSQGPFLARPENYETLLPKLSDGKMFYSMTFGKGMMGAYRSQLTAEERWKVIHYIKDLAGIVPAEDAPADITAEAEEEEEGHEAGEEHSDEHEGDTH